MTKKELVMDEVAKLPEPLFDLTLGFIRFLKKQSANRRKLGLDIETYISYLKAKERGEKRIPIDKAISGL